MIPRSGETILGNEARTGLGGKGAKQAVATALAGAPTAMIARVGADPEGVLARAGWPSAQRSSHGSPRSRARAPGAPGSWGPARISAGRAVDPLAEAARDAVVVLSQPAVSLSVAWAAAEVASGVDTSFVLNAAPAAALPDELLAPVDVLIVNEHELAAVARAEPNPQERAHTVLRERVVRAVVTTLGPRGAAATDADGVSTRIPAVPAPQVVAPSVPGTLSPGCVRLDSLWVPRCPAPRAGAVSPVRWRFERLVLEVPTQTLKRRGEKLFSRHARPTRHARGELTALGNGAASVRRKASLLLVFLAVVLSLVCGAGTSRLTLDRTPSQLESLATGHQQHDSPAQPRQPHLSHWTHARVSTPPSTFPSAQPLTLAGPAVPVALPGYHPASPGAVDALAASRSPSALQVFRS